MTFDLVVFSTEAALTPTQLDALADSDSDLIAQGTSESFVAFEAETSKATLVAGTPETWSVS